MAQLEAKARELVCSKELESTVTYLCGLGDRVAGSEEELKACDLALLGRLPSGRDHLVVMQASENLHICCRPHVQRSASWDAPEQTKDGKALFVQSPENCDPGRWIAGQNRR